MAPDGLVYLKRKPGEKGKPAQIGVGDGQVVPNDEALKLRWVRGIASRLSDVKVRGQKWTLVFGPSLLSGTLTRTMHGASTLTLVVADPNRKITESKLFQERHEVELDGLYWRFVKLSNPGIGQPVTLTYEPKVVAQLREIKGPHKAFRDKVTRAEFVKRLALMARPRPRVISPELHTIQPIRTSREANQAKNEALDERRGGIDSGARLTVKGVKVTPAQIDAADRALRVAEADGAPELARVALMVSLIVESLIGKIASNWLGVEDFVASAGGFSATDLEESVSHFLNGYTPGDEGAIEYAEAHPDAKAYAVAQAIQRSGAGAPSGGADNYGPWVQEARDFVDAFGGASTVSTSVTQRYAFKQKEKESNWACMQRLAGEVNWRCFESAGWLYYTDEETLLRQKLRLRIGPHAPGVEQISFDYDVGKEVTEVAVSARAHSWAAPPGTAVAVGGCGPANGTYLVDTIEADLKRRNSLVKITLKRPTEPLAEPAPTTKTSTRSLGGAGLDGAPTAVARMHDEAEAIAAKNLAYQWGGTGNPSYDCSGFVSHLLNVGGLLEGRLLVGLGGGLEDWGRPGEGEYVTVWCKVTGNAKTSHVIIEIAGDFFESGGGSNPNPNGGPTKFSPSAGYLSGFIARQPKGLGALA